MKTKILPESYSTEVHNIIIKGLLSRCDGNSYSYIGLSKAIKKIASYILISIGDNKAKAFITYYIQQKIIDKIEAGVYVIKPI